MPPRTDINREIADIGKAAAEGKPPTVCPLADLDHVFKLMRSGESAEEIFASEE